MKINKVLCIVGGIISIFSVFLPVFSMTMTGVLGGDYIFYYWMFGFAIFHKKGGTNLNPQFYSDVVGIICMILIIIGAIISIIYAFKDPKKGHLFLEVEAPSELEGKSGSILIIAGIITYFVIFSLIWYTDSNMLIEFAARFSGHPNVLIPSYGFFVAIIGGIISLIGSKQGD